MTRREWFMVLAALVPVPALAQQRAAMAPKTPPVECNTRDQCRYVEQGTVVTPRDCGRAVFNRAGEPVSSPERCGTMTTTWRCLSCDRTWTESVERAM